MDDIPFSPGADCSASTKQLWDNYRRAKTSNEQRHACGALIRRHIGYVYRVADAVYRRLYRNRVASYAELVCAGCYGLMLAVQSFDRSYHNSFGAFAKHRIRGEMIDWMRDELETSRDDRAFVKRRETFTNNLLCETGHASDKQIANRMQMRLSRMNAKGRTVATKMHVTVSDTCKYTDIASRRQLTAAGKYRGRDHDPTEPLEAKMFQDYMFRGLPAREKRIMRCLYWHNMTMKQVGDAIGISESRVSQLHSAALDAIRGRVGHMTMDELI